MSTEPATQGKGRNGDESRDYCRMSSFQHDAVKNFQVWNFLQK